MYYDKSWSVYFLNLCFYLYHFNQCISRSPLCNCWIVVFFLYLYHFKQCIKVDLQVVIADILSSFFFSLYMTLWMNLMYFMDMLAMNMIGCMEMLAMSLLIFMPYWYCFVFHVVTRTMLTNINIFYSFYEWV